MPYRTPSPPPQTPRKAPWRARAGQCLEHGIAFALFALAIAWGGELGVAAWGFVQAVQAITPSGHGLARAFGP